MPYCRPWAETSLTRAPATTGPTTIRADRSESAAGIAVWFDRWLIGAGSDTTSGAWLRLGRAAVAGVLPEIHRRQAPSVSCSPDAVSAMSRLTDQGPLRDMLYFARTAIEVFDGAGPDALEGNSAGHFALRYLLVAVGGAAHKVSPEFRTAHGEVAWEEVEATRKALVHGYDRVERERLHDAIAVDLPRLVGQLDAILEDESEELLSGKGTPRSDSRETVVRSARLRRAVPT